MAQRLQYVDSELAVPNNRSHEERPAVRRHHNSDCGDEAGYRGVAVTVRDRRNRSYRGLMVELHHDGVAAEYLHPGVPELALGSQLDIQIHSDSLRAEISPCVMVIGREESPFSRLYRLRIVDNGDAQSHIADFRGVLNRRDSFRVRPPAMLPVPAIIPQPSGDAPLVVHVRDVSITGMCIVAPLAMETELAASLAMSMEVNLPDANVSLELVVDIRNRRLHQDSVVYGVRVDMDRTPESSRVRDLFVDYVASVQRLEVRGI